MLLIIVRKRVLVASQTRSVRGYCLTRTAGSPIICQAVNINDSPTTESS